MCDDSPGRRLRLRFVMPLRDILNRNAFRRPARNSPDVCAMSGYSLRRMKHSQSIDTFKSSSYPSSMRSETLTITCDLAMMRVITKLESSLISEKQRTPRRNTTPLARQDFSETQLKALSIERHQHASACISIVRAFVRTTQSETFHCVPSFVEVADRNDVPRLQH